MITDERRPAPNEGALSSPKDHVIDICNINASLLPRPGIEPGPAAWQARTLALHHVSGLNLIFYDNHLLSVFTAKSIAFSTKQGKAQARKTLILQSPSHAYKRFWSIIRKLAVVFLFAKIQNILIRNVWKTQKFAISLSIRTFKILKVTRILG